MHGANCAARAPGEYQLDGACSDAPRVFELVPSGDYAFVLVDGSSEELATALPTAVLVSGDDAVLQWNTHEGCNGSATEFGLAGTCAEPSCEWMLTAL